MVRYVSKEQALDSPLRRHLLQVVGGMPGINMKGLSDALGCQPSTVIWHAAMLQRAQLLRSEKVGGLRVFYLPTGQRSRDQVIEGALLHHEAARRIRDHVLRHPGATFASLEADLGMTISVLRWHVRRLVDNGVVCHDRQGRLVVLYPGDSPGTPCRRSLGAAIPA